MSGSWQVTNRGSLGTAATATQASPTGSLYGGQIVRLRALQLSLSGDTIGTDRVVVRDGASGLGTIIWSIDVAVAANGTAVVELTGLDLRATVGNALTVEFVSGVGSDRENINAQGDYVPVGNAFAL